MEHFRRHTPFPNFMFKRISLGNPKNILILALLIIPVDLSIFEPVYFYRVHVK